MRILITMAALYRVLGTPTFVVVALSAVLSSSHIFALRALRRNEGGLGALRTERIKKLHELLQSINVVKLFAWENHFGKGIAEVREEQLKVFQRATSPPPLVFCQALESNTDPNGFKQRNACLFFAYWI